MIRRRAILIRQAVRLATFIAAACVFALAASKEAWATQHLVNPGDDWTSLEKRARPGDEIILMPGRHHGVCFEALAGAAGRPITIRSADAAKLSEIVSDRECIRIKQPSNIVIKDLVMTGGSMWGISLGDWLDQHPEQEYGNVLIRNVKISKVGPRGQRHAIVATDLSNVQIDHCAFEGWGGSGIELVACRDCSIDACTFKGLADHSQSNGIRVRAGTARVQIQNCRFENAGEHGISMGGTSDLAEFQPTVPAGAPKGSIAEASAINVDHCIIVGSPCAIAFSHADECTARSNTIVRPRRTVVSVTADQSDPRLSPGRRNVFGMNLVMWEPGDLKRRFETGAKADLDSFVVEENLWWSTEAADALKRLGPVPGKSTSMQVTDVDPKLDAEYVPGSPEAKPYGAK